jgi:hypothetical protein
VSETPRTPSTDTDDVGRGLLRNLRPVVVSPIYVPENYPSRDDAHSAASSRAAGAADTQLTDGAGQRWAQQRSSRTYTVEAYNIYLKTVDLYHTRRAYP